MAASHRKIPRKARAVATPASVMSSMPSPPSGSQSGQVCTLSSDFISALVSAPQAAMIMTQYPNQQAHTKTNWPDPMKAGRGSCPRA